MLTWNQFDSLDAMKDNLNTYEITPSSQREVVKLNNEHELLLSSNLNQIFRYTKSMQNELSEVQGANLLLSFASIVSKEIDEEDVDWEDDIRCSFPLGVVDTENLFVDRGTSNKDLDFTGRTKISVTNIPHRIRSVSLDVCDESQDGSINEVSLSSSRSGLVSPTDSPVISSINRRNPKRGAKMKSLTLNKRSEIPTKKSVEAKGKLNRPVETILRKKFSWKNYPEVSTSDWLIYSCMRTFEIHLTSSYSVGGLSHCQSRRISSSFSLELYCAAKAVQQQAD
jgi:hypothetical protein